jgi:dTDP-glucose pyrophosphorylase
VIFPLAEPTQSRRGEIELREWQNHLMSRGIVGDEAMIRNYIWTQDERERKEEQMNLEI